MLSAKQVTKLERAFALERQRFMDDPPYARSMAVHPCHGRIGEWITPDVGTKVLELGVGPGRYAALLQALGFETIGVDPIAYDSWEPLCRRGRMKFMSGIKAEALPFEDRTFDHVACMGALLYFEDPARALQEIRRVLKPGGHLVVRTQNRRNLYAISTRNPLEPAAHNFYTLQELVDVLNSQGFVVERSFAWGLWVPYLHMSWFYFFNVYLTPRIMTILTALTPSQFRHNVIAFARRPLE
jgi:SAM-dependent methyltransferase